MKYYFFIAFLCVKTLTPNDTQSEKKIHQSTLNQEEEGWDDRCDEKCWGNIFKCFVFFRCMEVVKEEDERVTEATPLQKNKSPLITSIVRHVSNNSQHHH